MSQAWLLDLGAGCAGAVAIGELVHLLYSPSIFAVPQTPPHACHVLEWNGKLLPLIDLAHWLRAVSDQEQPVVVGIIACQRSQGSTVEYAALRLAAPPVRINVEDDQACHLPESGERWSDIALSCFDHKGKSVPILDTWRLTSDVLAPDLP